MAPPHLSYVDGSTALCPLTDGAAQLFERWFADQDLVAMMGDWDFLPLPYYEQTPEEFVRRIRPTTWLVCAVNDGSALPIGYTGLLLQRRHRVGILRLAIAESAHRNQGHGRRATRMALEWAFERLDLFKVQLSVADANRPAVDLYKSVGFSECGRYRLARHMPKGRSDEILMELMREDWQAQR